MAIDDFRPEPDIDACVICGGKQIDGGLCERHLYDEQRERLTRPHRDRKWPRGETPSLFEGSPHD